MDKYSRNINDYRVLTKTLAINSSFNTIAGYYRIDNIEGTNSSVVTGTVSVNSRYCNKAYSTSVSINECSVIAGYYQITEDNVSIDTITSNRLKTNSDSDNCLMQIHILLPDITGLFISNN